MAPIELRNANKLYTRLRSKSRTKTRIHNQDRRPASTSGHRTTIRQRTETSKPTPSQSPGRQYRLSQATTNSVPQPRQTLHIGPSPPTKHQHPQSSHTQRPIIYNSRSDNLQSKKLQNLPELHLTGPESACTLPSWLQKNRLSRDPNPRLAPVFATIVPKNHARHPPLGAATTEGYICT